MSIRVVEIVGLIAAWLLIVAIRIIDGAQSAQDDSLDGLLVALEIASWLCVMVVIAALVRRGNAGAANLWSARVIVVTMALLVLVAAGVLSMTSTHRGGNIGLGLFYLVGFALLVASSVLVLRRGSRHAGREGSRLPM